MKGISIEERAVTLAHYIIDSKDTVRGTAKKFGISKSTVHKDLSQRLEKINLDLFTSVREILDENKEEIWEFKNIIIIILTFYTDYS